MKKKLLIRLPAFIAALAICLSIFLFRTDFSAQRQSDAQLHALTDRFFREELRASTLNLHYTLADPAAFGIEDYDISLGSFSDQDLPGSRLLIENYKAALLAIDPSSLSDDMRFTWEVLKYILDQSMEGLDWYYFNEPLSPTLGIQAQLPILLAEYAFYQERDIQDYLALLSQTETYFQSILDFEQKKIDRGLFMSDEILEAIIDQCQDFLIDSDTSYLEELFIEKLNALPSLTDAQRSSYIQKHKDLLSSSFFPAYEQLILGLTDLKGSGNNPYGLYYFPDGTDYYAYLIRAVTGSDRTPEAFWQLLLEQQKLYTSQMQSLLASDPSLADAAAASLNLPEPAKILSFLHQQISRDFPELPNTSFTVRKVHPSLQPHSSPAFYLTPPLDRMEENTIYINPAADFQDTELFTTLAHEGYPGHLYQTIYSYTYCPNPLQGLISIGGYTEGWATYAELYAYDLLGLEPDAAALLRLNKCWTLNLYCTIDMGIHYYGWTLYDVYSFLSGYGINNLTAAREIVQAVIQDPANYLRYYAGYLEFQSLLDRAQYALGNNFDKKEFHQTLLRLGPAPFSLLEKEIDRYISEKD